MSNDPKNTASSSSSDESDFVNVTTPTSGHFEIVIPHEDVRERQENLKTLETRLHDAEYAVIDYKTKLATAYAKIKAMEEEAGRLRPLGPASQALGPSNEALEDLGPSGSDPAGSGSASGALSPPGLGSASGDLWSELGLGYVCEALKASDPACQALKALCSELGLGPSSQALGPSSHALKAQIAAKDLQIQSLTLKFENLKAQHQKPDALRELNRLLTVQNQELRDRLDSAHKGLNEGLEEKIRENLVLKSDLEATNQQIDMIYERNEREKTALKQEHAEVVADKDREIEELNATILLMKQW